VYVFFLMIRSPPKPTLSPYTTLFRSAYVALRLAGDHPDEEHMRAARRVVLDGGGLHGTRVFTRIWLALFGLWRWDEVPALPPERSEEHTSELQSRFDLVCRLLLEKKN